MTRRICNRNNGVIKARRHMRHPNGNGTYHFFSSTNSRLFHFFICSFTLLIHRLFLFVSNSFAFSFSSSRIGASPLPPDGKPKAMTHSSIGMDVDEPFDVVLNLPSQIPFRDVFCLEKSIELCDII